LSARSEWGEGSLSGKEDLKEDNTISMTSEKSRMSFEPARHSIDRTMEICYEATNTNPNSIYIPIKVCLEGYNKYELCAYIDSDCFVCFSKIYMESW